MEKMRRSARVIVIIKELLDRPNHLFSLNHFTEKYQAAKSSISEDLSLLKETLEEFNLGEIETVAGAAGGVRYMPKPGKEDSRSFLLELCKKLATPERIIPGGFLYMTDIIFDPYIISKLGEIFAGRFADLKPDYILTIETKGIPLAMMTARALDIPLVIVRDASKVTEGSSVNINYVSGSSKRIQTMSLPKRALPAKSRVLIIDDFMKAGGTARGMMELLEEFEATVVGIGIFMATREPQQKLVNNYVALLEMEHFDENKKEVRIVAKLDY